LLACSGTAASLDVDVQGYSDSIDWGLLLKAVRKHTDCPWVRLYIERWLKAPVQMEDGSVVPRTAGTPQGGVISPCLADRFLHYAFDVWTVREFPDIPFERYADLPTGAERSRLDVWLTDQVPSRFAARVLPVDAQTADHCSRIMARTQASGHPLGTMDAFIPATAERHGLALVTRNVPQFGSLGIRPVSSWSSG
jgi:predicted nucleic acid-binding protein